jgi:hypothetical protein
MHKHDKMIQTILDQSGESNEISIKDLETFRDFLDDQAFKYFEAIQKLRNEHAKRMTIGSFNKSKEMARLFNTIIINTRNIHRCREELKDILGDESSFLDKSIYDNFVNDRIFNIETSSKIIRKSFDDLKLFICS